jgi:hypothetical protein
MKTISEQLGTIIGLGIDINLFFSVTISEYQISLLGHYTEEFEEYLIANGFEFFDYLYADNQDWIELTKDGCRIALDKR